MMSMLFALVVLICSINTISSSTPYKDCGSETGTVLDFSVTDCTAAPCKFIKGQTYSMNLTFTAKAPSQTAAAYIHGVIGGVPVPFPLPDPDACKMNVQCPVAAGANNTATLALPVLSSYPSISLYVKIELKDASNKDFACLLFPATISSGLNGRHPSLGWKRGKLFN